MSAIAQESFELIHKLVLALLYEANFRSTVKHELIQCLRWRSSTVEPLSALVSNVSDRSWTRAEREIRDAIERDVAIISVFDPLYPRKLLQVYDPPVLLFVRGRMPQPAAITGEDPQLTVAIVGTRKATPYGIRNAFRLAREITQSRSIVASGLALGIDTAAHEGALDAIRTDQQSEIQTSEFQRGLFDKPMSPGVAVLGSGVLNIYPQENINLAQALLEAGGCVISEYGLKASPMSHYFPERNRIISGMSDAVVVVEAPTKSGAMITARLALEEGREVLAVPGPADSCMSDGPHELIRSGAGIVTSSEDLLNVSQWCSKRKFKRLGAKKRPKDANAIPNSRNKSAVPYEALKSAALINASLELAAEQKAAAISIIHFLETRGATDLEQLVAAVSQNSESTPTALSALISWLEVNGVVATGAGSVISLAERNDSGPY